MLINRESNLHINRESNGIDNYYINLNKHYPFFKLFDLTNNNTLKYHTSYSSFIDYIYFTSPTINFNCQEYNSTHLLAFLEDKRNNNLDYYKESTYNLNRHISKLSSYINLKKLVYMKNIYYSTYTFGIDNRFIFLLCIKPEYIYYVKLCYLANKEIEFDCFYILVRNNGKDLLHTRNELRFYNSIVKSIKHYGCKLIYVDSIEDEINNQIKLPKFNTTKDYTNWLDTIKNGFVNSNKENECSKKVEIPF